MPRIFSPACILPALLSAATPSFAANYTIDTNHTHIVFLIDHLGFAKIVGLFTDFSGTFTFDPANVATSKLTVTINTDSLQTQYSQRDKDLKGADWFNVTEFPTMTFVGTHYAKKDEHTGTITGDLTLLGTTKPVTLSVVLNKVGTNPLDHIESAGFSARGTLKRSDFGMKTFLPAIGDEVDLIVEVEAKQKS
jgi:polyisoprenoid-binding protein YceI